MELNNIESGNAEQKPESDINNNITRRGFFKKIRDSIVSALAIIFVGDQISGGDGINKLSQLINPNDAEKISDIVVNKAEEKLQELDENHPEMPEAHKRANVIDYIGCISFAIGIRDLLPGGHGFIHFYHYLFLSSLLSAKYAFGTDDQRHHLIAELVANAKAAGIIASSMVIAEGVHLDFAGAVKEAKGDAKFSTSDKVALTHMMASVLSPLATTVASAGSLKALTNDIAGDDTGIMAVEVSHVSNLSGFLLFGDPPFIAVCEKYGFLEGIKWQMRTMWPLAMYSLFTSTFKTNLQLNKEATEPWKNAMIDTASGLSKNLPLLAKIMLKSLQNFAKANGVVLESFFPQDTGGIEFHIGEAFINKGKATIDLLLQTNFAVTAGHHTPHDTRTADTSIAVDAFAKGMGSILANYSNLGEDLKQDTKPDAPSDDIVAALASGDEEQLKRLLNESNHIKNTEILISIIKGWKDNLAIDGSSTEEQRLELMRRLNPINVYKKATDIGNIKKYLGHELGDVIDVFPFQAGHIEFLVPVFKEILQKAEGFINENFAEDLRAKAKEALVFLMVAGFSMVADNFVACKVGLELMPDKPQFALIAAIIGGSLSSIGNMANVAQFSLDKNPLMTSVKQAMKWNIDTVGMGMLWSYALDAMKDLNMFAPPNSKVPSVASVQEHTRRGFFETLLPFAT